MAKFVYWQFDNNKIVQIHKISALPDAVKADKLLGLFEFEVRRYKDTNSKKEQLEIIAFIQGDKYGEITTSLTNIESDIVRFKSYGVVLDRPKYVELCRLISDNYYYFEYIETGKIDNVVSDVVADEVFVLLCQYILENRIEPKTVSDRKSGGMELYNIPLKDFISELSDSKFRSYNFTEIKEKLREKDYTHTNQSKFDYVVSENGQKVKMISIHKDKAEPVLEKLSIAEIKG